MNWLQKIAQNRDRHLYEDFEHKPVSEYPMGGAGAFHKDWIEVVAQIFQRHPHPDAGKFIQWTKPNLGQVSFMNETETVRIELRMDAQYVGDASTLVYVSTREGTVGSKRVHKNMARGLTPSSELDQLAQAIVEAAYDLIDKYVQFSNDMGLDPDWKTAQTEDEYLHEESNHDYDISWDYERNDDPSPHLVSLIESIVKENELPNH